MTNIKGKLRKGMIILDTSSFNVKRKILSKPFSGELPDYLVKLGGKKTNKYYERIVLCSLTEDEEKNTINYAMTYNNQRCVIVFLDEIELPNQNK